MQLPLASTGSAVGNCVSLMSCILCARLDMPIYNTSLCLGLAPLSSCRGKNNNSRVSPTFAWLQCFVHTEEIEQEEER